MRITNRHVFAKPLRAKGIGGRGAGTARLEDVRDGSSQAFNGCFHAGSITPHG
jgi:hypothetical protein